MSGPDGRRSKSYQEQVLPGQPTQVTGQPQPFDDEDFKSTVVTPFNAYSVRLDVRSDFTADAPTTTNHRVSMDVESEFKTRQTKHRSFFMTLDVESEFGADG